MFYNSIRNKKYTERKEIIMKNKAANQLFAGILAVTLVVTGPMVPLTSAQAATTKTVTVTNEKQLKAALKNNKVTKITIKTSKNTTFTIPNNLNSQINDLILIIPAIVNKGMYIGDRENPRRGKVFENIEKQLPKGYVDYCHKVLCRDTILKKSLLSQNIYTDFYIGG